MMSEIPVTISDDRKIRHAKAGVVIFYLVGLAGLLIPFSHDFFLRLFPYFLVLNAIVLAMFHEGKFGIKVWLVFTLVYMFSLATEMIGVNTGFIFGQYRYGQSLGLKVLHTPLVIGLNWLMLIYLTAGIVGKFRLSPAWQVLLASAAMLVYDLVLEQVAPALDMWHWITDGAPLLNYLAWFTLAVIFHCIIKLMRVKIVNPLAAVIFACQFLFFLILLIFLP